MASEVRQIPLTCPGHSRPVVFLQYTGLTPDGAFFVSACKDGKPMIREAKSGDWVGTFLGHKGAVWGAAIDQQGLRVATASADFTAKLWDAVTGNEIHTFPHPHIVRSVAFSEDATKLVTGCQDHKIRVFDLTHPENDPIVLEGHASTVKVVLFGADPSQLLSAADEQNVKVWDWQAGSLLKELPSSQPVTSMELSWDKTILTATCGEQVQLWDAHKLTLMRTLEVGVPVQSASLHPLNTRVAVGGLDFWVRVLDINHGEVDTLKGHFGPVHCVRYAPDGDSFASGSEDGTIRIWQSNPAQHMQDDAQPGEDEAAGEGEGEGVGAKQPDDGKGVQENGKQEKEQEQQ